MFYTAFAPRLMRAFVTSVWDRFWAKVVRGPGCWEWQACRNAHGYGRIGVGQHVALAHRLMMEWVLGRPLRTKEHALHHCDNPACVRPSHLYVGTHQDNMDDMAARGRRVDSPSFGEDNGNAVLTRESIVQIREEARAGAASADIEARHGISAGYAGRIARGEAWAHVPGALSRDFRYRLTDAQCEEVRCRKVSGERAESIAADLGIGRTTVYRAVDRANGLGRRS